MLNFYWSIESKTQLLAHIQSSRALSKLGYAQKVLHRATVSIPTALRFKVLINKHSYKTLQPSVCSNIQYSDTIFIHTSYEEILHESFTSSFNMLGPSLAFPKVFRELNPRPSSTALFSLCISSQQGQAPASQRLFP